MGKKCGLAVMLVMLAGGCSREVYLQPVPCVEDCPETHCYIGQTEECPEVEELTVRQKFEVVDMPAATVTYDVNDDGQGVYRRCRTVCKEKKTN